MKGTVFAFSLFVLTLAVSLALMSFVHFEHVRSTLSTDVKRAIQYTMLELINRKETTEIDPTMAIEVFSDFFKTLVYEEYEYTIQLMGFHEKPLMLRFVIQAKNQNLMNSSVMEFEEAMIEEKSREV